MLATDLLPSLQINFKSVNISLNQEGQTYQKNNFFHQWARMSMEKIGKSMAKTMKPTTKPTLKTMAGSIKVVMTRIFSLISDSYVSAISFKDSCKEPLSSATANI